ncbi:hypothetical protein OG889_09530 [Streptomyces sp. NBC_00481]|uniref:hypothetical protein n=1 Tax=unclassified Streptomyces TaxID=2593676 RepID=UPI002DDAA0C7|nr:MULTISPECIES: hypothetical protein [unclassified Streptomyces]WRY94942.1 hypothetical protein OG889_09530 [Streptomyces sp. NBC_00481]
MSTKNKRLSTLAAPAIAAALLLGFSAPDAFAATTHKKTTTCSAAITPTSDAKIKVTTYYQKKTKTTWQHTARYYHPTSHGMKKSRSDFYIESYLMDGGTREKGLDINKKGSKRWDMTSWHFSYLKNQRPVTKKGKTRLVAHGWYAMNSWPTECKSQSFAF